MLLAAIACCSAAAVGTIPVKGLVAPTYTPLFANGTVDLSGIDRQAAVLRASNVTYVFSCGTTGESVDFTVAERKAVSERWIKLGGFRVIVHVGSDSVESARELAVHATRIGAFAVAAMPPTFIRPKSIAALVATMGAIAAAAPTLPFFYYHIPGAHISPALPRSSCLCLCGEHILRAILLSACDRAVCLRRCDMLLLTASLLLELRCPRAAATFVDFPMRAFLEQADGHIPSLAGIKYTHYDMSDLNQCLHFKGGKYTILYGRDQYLLSAVALGVHGAVGSTYNFLGGTMRHVLGAFDSTADAGALEVARATQLATATLLTEIDAWSAAYPGFYSLKEVENLVAASVGPPRLPFLPATAAAKADLKKRIVNWCGALPSKAAVPAWCGHLRE